MHDLCSQAPCAEVIIACEVMKVELELVSRGSDVRFFFLEQGLHRTPKKIAPLIQEKIDLVGESAKRIALAYGLCSGGIKGIRGRSQGLVVPRIHDCVAMFLGSSEAYKEVFQSNPATYYLTPGWVAAKKDPLGIIYDDYAPKHGLETALWVMEEELKHYKSITLINTGAENVESLRARARENCTELGKEYNEIEGNLDYFRKLIFGPHDSEDFVVIAPGVEVSEEMFLSDEEC
ncbi:MAG: DUF1638 domain-containing protein [Chloroflexota bacterium]